MDSRHDSVGLENCYPIVFIPKACTRLESNCDASENVFIDVKLTTCDTEGNQTCIYSGLCNLKLVDSYHVQIQQEELPSESDVEMYINNVDDIPVIMADSSSGDTSFNQSEEVWIDPSRSPYVYNHYEMQPPEASHYSIHQEMHTSQITFEQHNTFITKNVYDYKEAIHYSSSEDFEHKKFTKVQKRETSQSVESYENEELQCGVYVSHLPEEIMNEKETKEREEWNFIESVSDNSALKQLMSSNIQSGRKQRKTILFLGAESHRGHTVQQVAYTDPLRACPREVLGCGELEPHFESEVVIGERHSALKQLMSSNIQSGRKQRKTILFLGAESHRGHTVQQVAYTDPLRACPREVLGCGELEPHFESEVVIGERHSALKQLMSSNIQSGRKQRKTILFLGAESHRGHTVQQVAYTDPLRACPREVLGCGELEPHFESEVVIEATNCELPPNHKKYQCAKCQQIFDQISLLNAHMVNHPGPRRRRTSHTSGDLFPCVDCGKVFKTQERFDKHCFGHGDPELECNRCGKVFASKFTLRVHKKIHNRKHPCIHCSRTYSTADQLQTHVSKAHCFFMCEQCEYIAPGHSQLNTHMMEHHNGCSDSETETYEFIEETPSGSETDAQSPECPDWKLDDSNEKSDVVMRCDQPSQTVENGRNSDQVKEADDVIAKVMNNEAFLGGKTESNRKYIKVCDVCHKTFARVSDLKRHLIEHVIRSTLAKAPVNKFGTLNIQCEVCRTETFNEIDKYKAHLRDHAKLTLYECTFCNKSFSDSSNFSKHKKIHGATFFQCDLCQRKFNSKKTIEQHMEYHNKNPPLPCALCAKEFHFMSMLRKHVTSAHTHQVSNFRCRFCHKPFKNVKNKSDHEWEVHNVRKVVVDCLTCGCKFRKFADLKRHSLKKHNMKIPPASKLFKNWKGERQDLNTFE